MSDDHSTPSTTERAKARFFEGNEHFGAGRLQEARAS
jgi:hypothetical protein